jgi:hypothetical protein
MWHSRSSSTGLQTPQHNKVRGRDIRLVQPDHRNFKKTVFQSNEFEVIEGKRVKMSRDYHYFVDDELLPSSTCRD